MAKPAAKRTFKLDLMVLLEAIDKGNKEFYSNLTDEEKKGFAPSVVLRWLSVVSDNNPLKEYQLLAANDLVNYGLWELSKHPELLYLLMTVASTGKKQYHQWIPKKTTSSYPKIERLLKNTYPDTNDAEFNILLGMYSPDEILELALRNGSDDNTVKEVKAELKKFKGSD